MLCVLAVLRDSIITFSIAFICFSFNNLLYLSNVNLCIFEHIYIR